MTVIIGSKSELSLGLKWISGHVELKLIVINIMSMVIRNERYSLGEK